MNENAKLKVEVIDYAKALENLKRKDQMIEVNFNHMPYEDK